MILSKSNLLVVGITSVDKKMPVLHNVHVEGDGTTVARNNKALIMVSPVLPEIKEKLETILPESDAEVVTIPSDTISSVLKSIPADKKFKGLLEHTDLHTNDELGALNEVNFTLTDGKSNRTISGRKYERKYIPYKEALAQTLERINTGTKVVLDLNRLILLLQTIKKICPDTTKELPVFIEFTDDNDIIIRALNPINGQRVFALMTSYKGIEGKWLNYNEWEKQFFNNNKEKTVCKKKVKRKIRLKRKSK